MPGRAARYAPALLLCLILTLALAWHLACRGRPFRPSPGWTPEWLRGELSRRGLEYEWREVPASEGFAGLYFRREGCPVSWGEIARRPHGPHAVARMAEGYFYAHPTAW